MAARLDPAERDRRAEARRKARWADMRSGAAYRHYDPNDAIGRGSSEQWRSAADGNGWTSFASDSSIPPVNDDLAVFGLAAGWTKADLMQAFRQRVHAVHPDHGGSNEAFIAMRAAYDRLMEPMKRTARP